MPLGRKAILEISETRCRCGQGRRQKARQKIRVLQISGAADTGTTTETDTNSGTDTAAPLNELTVNGDFELGNISGWTDYYSDKNGTFAVVSKPVSGGAWAGNLVAKVPDNGVASFPVVKQANLGKGVVAPNDNIKISFDLYGEVAGVKHVVIAEFFSELADEGTSKTEILGGGPLLPTGANDWTKKWTTYSFTTTAGPDLNGGVTFQIKADCGPNKGCAVNLYIDNVSVSLKQLGFEGMELSPPASALDPWEPGDALLDARDYSHAQTW